MKADRVACVCGVCGASYEKRRDRVCSPDYCSINCRKVAQLAQRIDRGVHCEQCGKFFIPRVYLVQHGWGRFCSQACNSIAHRHLFHSAEAQKKARENWLKNGNAEKLRQRVGPKNPQWKGGRYESNGYAWQRDPGARRAQAEHRRVVEAHIGRPLRSDEIVHHVNHDKTDNRIENLQVMTRAEHMREHHAEISAARSSAAPRSKGSKIDINVASRIKADIRAGRPKREIAERYGITPTMVGYIQHGKNWSHAP